MASDMEWWPPVRNQMAYLDTNGKLHATSAKARRGSKICEISELLRRVTDLEWSDAEKVAVAMVTHSKALRIALRGSPAWNDCFESKDI